MLYGFLHGEWHLKSGHQVEEIFRRKNFVSHCREIGKNVVGLESGEKFE